MSVYVLEALGLDVVKIGFADRDPVARRDTLQCGCPVPLVILAILPDGTEADERYLHRRFRAHRTIGEFFALEGLVLDWLLGLPDRYKPADAAFRRRYGYRQLRTTKNGCME